MPHKPASPKRLKIALVPNWRRVLKNAWSVRLAGLAVVFQILEQILPQVQDVVPPGVFALLSIVSAAGMPILRIIQQGNVSDEQKS